MMGKRFFFSLNVVLLVNFMVLGALNLEAKERKKLPHPVIDYIAPIILEVIEIREAETEEGPMGHANYYIESSARFEVEMRQNPFTGRIGAAACTGYEVVFSKLKDREPFCFRLRYLDGKVVRAEGVSGREKAIYKEVPEAKRAWATVEDGAVMSRKDGKVEIKVWTSDPLLENVAAEEASSCVLVWKPEMTLGYVEIRDLINLSRQWSSSKFSTPETEKMCKGSVNVKIRAVGGEIDHYTCDFHGGVPTLVGRRRCNGGDFDGWILKK